MNQVSNQVAIKHGYRGTLCIETPPVGAREIDQVLQQFAFLGWFTSFLLDPQKLKMAWTGEGLRYVRLVRINAFEPDEVLVWAQTNFSHFVRNEAIHRAIDAEETVVMINFDDCKSTARTICCQCDLFRRSSNCIDFVVP